MRLISEDSRSPAGLAAPLLLAPGSPEVKSRPEPRQARDSGDMRSAVDLVLDRSLMEPPMPPPRPPYTPPLLAETPLLWISCRSWKLLDLARFPPLPPLLPPSYKLLVDLWKPNFFILEGGLASIFRESRRKKSLDGV